MPIRERLERSAAIERLERLAAYFILSPLSFLKPLLSSDREFCEYECCEIKMFHVLRPIISIGVARPIGLLERIDKRRNESFDPLLRDDYTKNLNSGRISHLANVVSKSGIPREAKLVVDGDLAVQCPIIDALQL